MLEFLNRFFNSNKKTKPLDVFSSGLLISVQNRLDKNALELFLKQIEVFTNDQSVAYSGKYKSIAFPYFEHSELFASLLIKHNSNEDTLTANLSLYNGIITKFEFNQEPRIFYSCDSWQDIDPIIIDVQLFFDPLNREHTYIDNGVDALKLSGILQRWYSNDILTSKLSTPLNETQISMLLSKYDTKFPDEYINIIRQTEGVELLDIISIYPLRDINAVDGLRCNGGCEMFVFAEVHGECSFYVKSGDYSGAIYFSPYDDIEDYFGISLTKAFSECLKNYCRYEKELLKKLILL